MNVSVIIVNFNGGSTIMRCLSALRDQTLRHDVTVIDNASVDNSLRMLAINFPETRLIPLRRNVGFARAANIGVLHSSTAEYVVMLNPDTVPQTNFLAEVVTPFAIDDRIGAAGGTLVFTARDDIIASAGIDVHRNGVAIDAHLGRRAASFTGIHPVFGASGGAVAYRRSAFLDAGGFCEPFFLYLEDVDLAWRLRLRGWDAVVNAAAVARHDYSSSAGEGSALKRRMLARNRLWTLARCLPDAMWTRDRLSILGFDAAAITLATARRDWASLSGRSGGLTGLPIRMRERTRIQASASVNWEDIDRWIKPAISPMRLLFLRRLTARYSSTMQD